MRGRFSPHDGQLYVSGLKGWASAAVDDGCLQRVRYTGKPVATAHRSPDLRQRPGDHVLAAARSATAEDPGSYHLEQWNYRYSAGYGSPDLKVSDPAAEGHDEVRRAIGNAARWRPHGVSGDSRPPAGQSDCQSNTRCAPPTGQPLRQTLVATTHVVPERRMDEAQLHRREPAAESLVDESSLAPGVLLRFRKASATSVRAGRLVAWHVPLDQPAGGGLTPGPFAATAAGYHQSPAAGRVSVSLHRQRLGEAARSMAS